MALLILFYLLRVDAEQDNPYLLYLKSQARSQRLWEERYWHLLVHYRKTWLGHLRSEASGPSFFLAKDGRHNPQAELEATLTSFFAPSVVDPERQHPQCQFPARYAWLRVRLLLDRSRLPEQPCPQFENWHQTVDASSITLVFASAYLNSPASMYGHTFLRLDRTVGRDGGDLLSHSLNYAAQTRESNGIFFALKGLAGQYPGRYWVMPYYVKIQQYSNMESRDLWEYHLTISKKELDQLLRHAWELQSTYFPYYFLNKNCSYQLLPLIETSVPRLSLTPAFSVWVIPADTIRILYQKDLVGSYRYRPSHLTVMRFRRSLLDDQERAVATQLVQDSADEGLKTLEHLAGERQALVLDAAEDYLLYMAGFSPDVEENIRARERKILIARRRLDIPVRPIPSASSDSPPHQGHRTARVGLGLGVNQESTFEEVAWRAALHDLLDSPQAYPSDSQLEMGNLRFRVDRRFGRIYIQDLTVLRIFSLTPWDSWIRQPSWKLQTGLKMADEFKMEPTKFLYYDLNAGRGLAAQTFFLRRQVYYVFGEADAGVGRVFRKGYRLGVGANVGLTLELNSIWRANIEGSYLGYAAGDGRPNFRLIFSQHLSLTNDLGLRLNLERRGGRREALLTSYAHF